MKTGIELIREERERQINVEGWTAEHDDEHMEGAIASAAAAYALSGAGFKDIDEMEVLDVERGAYVEIWPWGSSHWKPTPGQPIRDLIKAGALIAAEIDRLQRSAAAEH